MIVQPYDQKYAPDFKDQKFGTKLQLWAWLKDYTKYVVELEDEGQDLIVLYLDAGGEILSVEIPSMNHFYASRIVELDTLEVGEPLGILIPEKQSTRYLDWNVAAIKDKRAVATVGA